MPTTGPLSRRSAVAVLAALAAGVLLPATPARALAALRRLGPVTHPEPRPGITAARVLASADVPEKAREAYEAARAIPQVLDGLYCHCECGERDGLRSLLECFESRMPVNCRICLGEADLAHRLHRDGKSLAEIRAAVDERYGD